MNGLTKVAIAAVLGVAAWAAPTAASAVGVTSPDGGARAAELDNWSRIRICDVERDDYGVYSHYIMNRGAGGGTIGEYGGYGQCNETGRLGSAGIVRQFNACWDLPAPRDDSCSAYVYQ